eukprot:GHVS01082137.1.p1 GENE.GHVS01082137.1~~GHVS01082137.1.p1  ORF type:complete len:101 (+),score=6.93 GHVS01082137.1:285-587(+)
MCGRCAGLIVGMQRLRRTSSKRCKSNIFCSRRLYLLYHVHMCKHICADVYKYADGLLLSVLREVPVRCSPVASTGTSRLESVTLVAAVTFCNVGGGSHIL